MIKKFFSLLSYSEKKNFLFLLLLITTTSFFDMLGIASILPFIAILSNPSIIETNEIISSVYKIFSRHGVENINDFFFVTGIIVFILLLFSLLLRCLTNFISIRFSLMKEYSIGKSLMEGYLNQPYVWFLNRNSSNLGKNILSEVAIVIKGILMPLVKLISQGILTIMITLLLISIDFATAVNVGFTLLLSYIVIFQFVKKLLSKIGIKRLFYNNRRFKIIFETFGSIKELKIRDLEKMSTDRFAKTAKAYAHQQSMGAAISDLPRYFIEGLAFGGIIIIILFFINSGKNFGNIVPIITLYVIAGYRLLPAAQQIFASIASIRSTKSAFDNLYSDLQNLKITKQKKIKKKINISLSKFILLKNIVFRYPGSKETILKKINLKIPAFAKIGIVGETGSGKTTLVDIILGLLDPNKGKILIDGKSINRNNKKFWQENIGYVSQDIYLSDNTLAENIAFGIDLQNINYDLVKQSAKIANIDNFIDNKLPQKYSTVVGERGVRLSGGQRQRIGIARALYQKPRVLILDEATSALDNINEKIIINNINQLKDKITLIVIAHRLSTVKNYDLILVLHEGKLVAKGSFDKLKKTNNIFRNLISKSKFKV